MLLQLMRHFAESDVFGLSIWAGGGFVDTRTRINGCWGKVGAMVLWIESVGTWVLVDGRKCFFKTFYEKSTYLWCAETPRFFSSFIFICTYNAFGLKIRHSHGTWDGGKISWSKIAQRSRVHVREQCKYILLLRCSICVYIFRQTCLSEKR